ncbi:hypothetical protein ACGFYT_27260 [Streptomyces sp. NPDC048208]|uniref:hypothetical protein n=1 Tax=Streptomyces sp. NPDC048208 TaxID=3365515 RepID=UPI0037200514
MVDTNLRGLRRKLNCVGASPTVLVHQLITQKLVPQPPVPEGPVPLLSQLQRDLLTALVTQPTQKAVAATVFMGVSKLQTEIDRLQAATGSTDRIQIVVRAHGWGLLRSSGTATATVVGAGR